MKNFASTSKLSVWLIFSLLIAALAGCGGGGGQDPILGAGGAVLTPSITSTTPVNAATSVATSSTVTATFNQAMAPATVTAAGVFTLTGPGATAVAGTVTYTGVVATFTPTAALAADTLFTATVTTGAKSLAGVALVSNTVWTFTTGPAPMVSSTGAANGATGLPTNRVSSAVFSEAMNPTTINGTTYTLTGPGTTPVAGTVSYSGVTATFTPTALLAPNTLFTATITTGAKDLAGNPLAANYVWSWSTGALPDTTAPTVTSTGPVNGAVGQPNNRAATAIFSEVMTATTITGTTFTLTGPGATPVAGVVTYSGVTATFTPNAPLTASTLYTSTVTTGAKDLAANPLAANYVWTWTTGAAPDTVAPTVISTGAPNGATGLSVNRASSAVFSEQMDPLTINTASFKVTGPGLTPVIGTVTYAGVTATFTPAAQLAPMTTYTSTITTAAKDLAGNPLAANFVWSWTTGASVAVLAPVNLRSLSTFVAVAGAGLTNSNSGGVTTLNGNVGLSPTATCLGDGSPCSAINPVINGTLYAADPGGVAAQAKADLILAYNDATGRPPGTTVNDITGMVLAPGVYTSGSTMSVAVGGTLTLDAQGDANAVWIFQIGSSLTVNNGAQVLLINGAKANNVFWAAFASSTLGSTVIFKGNVLAGASNSLGTGSVVEGRLLCTTGQITLLSNTVTLPLP